MKRILVQGETGFRKVALVEDGRLVEYHLEQPTESAYAGNIYKGRVVNVLPGMQAAFVDIGLRKNAFLYVDDLLPAHQEQRPAVKPPITELVKEGAELLVQVKKEPFGTKGARITTHLTIPGRFVVLMPKAGYIAVSKKIESDPERNRLKQLADKLRQDEDGFIVRTVAADESAEAIERDTRFVYGLWAAIQARSAADKHVPALLYRELDLLPRLVRDLFSDEVDELVLSGAGLAREMTEWSRGAAPALVERVKLHDSGEPLFEQFGVDRQLEAAMQRQILLPSGGYLVVDRTEALTVIDVNTGKYVGGEDLEMTVFGTNLEAAEEIARLIRLRDWGGIIVVDFIDMEQEDHRRQIAERLQAGLKRDRNQGLVVGWTKLGLLELTRKKVRPSLDRHFFHECAHCNGHGFVPTSEHPSRRRRSDR